MNRYVLACIACFAMLFALPAKSEAGGLGRLGVGGCGLGGCGGFNQQFTATFQGGNQGFGGRQFGGFFGGRTLFVPRNQGVQVKHFQGRFGVRTTIKHRF